MSSQIAFIFVLPFLRKIKRRALWSSGALLVSALGIALCALPHLARDPATLAGGWQVGLTVNRVSPSTRK